MSDRSVLLLLEDIDFAINHIFEYVAGFTFEQYATDYKTRDAVERNFMIIGEAASRFPGNFKENYNHIEWRIIKDFRNFIIHEYFGINNLIVWDTIQLRLPQLQNEIRTIITAIKTAGN